MNFDLVSFLTGLVLSAAAAAAFFMYKLSASKSVIAALEADKNNLSQAKAEKQTQLDALSKTADELNAQIVSFKTQQARLEAEKQKLEEMKASQKADFEELQRLAKSQFKELASDILKEKSEDLKKSAVNPLSEQMEVFKSQIVSLEAAASQRHGSLDKELQNLKTLNTNLHEEAASLTKALSKNKVQGNFGEILLERVLEWGGLTEGVNFERQKHFKDKNGAEKILDILLYLPQERRLIIDSKMSLENYKNYVSAADPAQKEAELLKHIASIKAHIDELAASGYKNLVDNSLDLLVMFIPVEYSYFIALERDGSLNEYASQKGVVLATASSLFAIVSSVQHFWKTQKQLKKIREILKIGQDLYDRMNNFAADMDKVGDAIDSSKKAFTASRNRILGTRGLVVSARKLVECGISRSSQKAIDLLEVEEEDFSLPAPAAKPVKEDAAAPDAPPKTEPADGLF